MLVTLRPVMRSLLLLLVTWPLLLGAQPPRFRFPLDDSGLSADVRRAYDSVSIALDIAHGCPSRADTLWAADQRMEIPRYWLEASIKQECSVASLPNAVRRRLRDDSRSLRYYEHVVQHDSSASENARAIALQYLIWSADARYFSLILHAATEQEPGVTPVGDYNVTYRAIVALAPYLSTSRAARRVVERAVNRSSHYARTAGLNALVSANNAWSRRLLRRQSLADLDDYTRRQVARALAHAPCPPGLVFVEWFGIEGQDYSKCELPPDFR
jgi:hypothetical protein